MGILDSLTKKLDDLNTNMKNGGTEVESGTEQMVGRRAFITDPYLQVSSSVGSYRAKFTRLSNARLREASIRDTIISAIIRHRRTQIESFCNIPNTRFDTGFAFVRRDGKELQDGDHKAINELANFIYFCGDTKKTPEEERSTMATEFGMMVQDALTFGHVTIEKVRDKLGGLQRFRHVPSESIYYAGHLAGSQNMQKLTDAQLAGYGLKRPGVQTPDLKEAKFIQVIEAREVMPFSEDTMMFKLYQPPSFIDNNGYSTSLVEACILSITRHLQAENYNSLFFTHGFAARGLLHLKGNVSQQNLQMFRNQFNAVINGNNNSWRTPIVAGLDDVQWIALAGTSRDMEYIQYTDHLIRTICAQAMIDPTEIGFEYLSRGTQQSSLNSPNNEWKLTASQERGLVPLLRFFEDIVNHDIMPLIAPNLAEEYLFKFIGLTSENKQQEITRLQAEMTVHASLNDLLVQVKKKPIDKTVGGDLPLNNIWWNSVKELLTVGEIRENFMGDEGASEREELQFIPSQSFLAWQTFLQSKKQATQQATQQAQQAKLEQQENNMQGASLNPQQGPSPELPVK